MIFRKSSYSLIGGIIALLVITGYQTYQYAEQLWNHRVLDKQQLYTLKENTRLIDVFEQLHPLAPQQRFVLKGWLRLYPQLAKIKAGTYQLPAQASFAKIAAILRSGNVYQYHITFVDGETMTQWWQQLQQAPGIKINQASLTQVTAELGFSNGNMEGWLLPETYYYTQGTTAEALLNRAYQAMRQFLAQTWQTRKAGLPIRSPYQLLVLASIIEKETGEVEEMPKVASVFVNRLHQHMRLQSDPTVIYGLGDAYTGNLTRANLRQKTRYNTYVIYGLPPTPIAMPGRSAIQAAAHPANTNYYYFVADGSGGHHFSVNLQEHNQAVRKYILKR
ncbi:endolytic transglycosylase MltG [Celerinatantimonas yamalensis]|uniref:Endolytic murein transglycosylase n=1 Tax=Celerinatantimonas yamalensis TaxID=559956 RepID=A0ABW9G3B7_9GAMM